jgi:hypothetical protein
MPDVLVATPKPIAINPDVIVGRLGWPLFHDDRRRGLLDNDVLRLGLRLCHDDRRRLRLGRWRLERRRLGQGLGLRLQLRLPLRITSLLVGGSLAVAAAQQIQACDGHRYT